MDVLGMAPNVCSVQLATLLNRAISAGRARSDGPHNSFAVIAEAELLAISGADECAAGAGA